VKKKKLKKHVLTAFQELYKHYADSIKEVFLPSFKVGDLFWLKRPSNYIPNFSTKLCPEEIWAFQNYGRP